MSKITGTITSTVTIGSGGFKSPLTITKTGFVSVYAGIYKGQYGAAGLYLNHSGFATIVNDGYVSGASGSQQFQSNGGAGAELTSAATLSNAGTIIGGSAGGQMTGGLAGTGVRAESYVTINNTGKIYGGATSNNYYGASPGGTGVYLYSRDIVTNSGTIAGSAGGSCEYVTAGPGIGGTGLLGAPVSGNTVTNSGVIEGGTGGHTDTNAGIGASGGDGVYLGDGTLTNTGKILGGAGGGYSGGQFFSASASGGTGGTGAYVYQGVLKNNGTILGGIGGYGHMYGGHGGTGVQLARHATATNTGTITGGNGSNSRLNTGGGGDGIDGKYDTIFNSGKITGGAGGSNGYYIGGAGTGVYLKAGLLTNSGTITGGAGGYANRYTAPQGDAVVLGVGVSYEGRYMDVPEFLLTSSTLVVDPGAVFKGAVISHNYGYNQYAAFSGSGENVLEVSGTSTKALSGIGTSITGFKDISFATGAAWTIQGNGAGLTSGQEIYGFTAGDTIDVSSLNFNPSDKLNVVTAGTLSITQGGLVTKIDIAGATKGESDFHVSKDKTGGTDLTRGTQPMQPKMTFLGSTISNAVVPVDKTLPPLEHAGGWMSVGNQGRDHTSVGIDLRPYGAVPAVLTPSMPFDGMFVPVTVQAG